MKPIQPPRKIEETITIPQGIEVVLDGRKIIVKGKLGTIERVITSQHIKFKKQDNMIIITSPSDLRKYKRLFYTIKSHIMNMIEGVQQLFTYKIKICSGHFPITVKIEGNNVIISNFLGEKIPRKSKILPNVAVKIDKDIITVQSFDLEAAGQTAANLEVTTSVGKRDRRVFQDGCHITEKPGRVFA